MGNVSGGKQGPRFRCRQWTLVEESPLAISMVLLAEMQADYGDASLLSWAKRSCRLDQEVLSVENEYGGPRYVAHFG